MKPCSGMRHVQNIGMSVTFNTGFFLQKTVFYGGKQWFSILESLLKMCPHGIHIKTYTTRIYTMQYAYHIWDGIDPTVIYISLFSGILFGVGPRT